MSHPVLIQPLVIQPDTRIAKDIAAVDEHHLPIMECFFGIEGEGSNVGEPRILLRVGGCRVGCRGCDTPHSWALTSSRLMHLSEVQSMLGELMAKHRVSTVAITGGEPMHYPKQMMVLAGWLREMKVRSWLETSGVIVSPEVFDCFDFVSFDVKTPSSGPACFDTDAVTKFRETVLRYDAGVRGGIGQVKMIVTDQRDIDWINQHFGDWLDHPPLRSSVTHSSPGPIIITPACGKNSTPQEVAHRMQLAADAWVGKNVRIIAQQHAILGMR